MMKMASRKLYVPDGIWDDNCLEMQPLCDVALMLIADVFKAAVVRGQYDLAGQRIGLPGAGKTGAPR
jgi:hypothetical protein